MPTKMTFKSYRNGLYSLVIGLLSLSLTLYMILPAEVEKEESTIVIPTELESLSPVEKQIFFRIGTNGSKMDERMYFRSIRPKFMDLGLTYIEHNKTEGYVTVRLTKRGREVQEVFYGKETS